MALAEFRQELRQSMTELTQSIRELTVTFVAGRIETNRNVNHAQAYKRVLPPLQPSMGSDPAASRGLYAPAAFDSTDDEDEKLGGVDFVNHPMLLFIVGADEAMMNP